MLWAFVPQDVLVETLEAAGTIVPVGPQSVVTGRATGEFIRAFDLRYSIVTSEDCRAMTRFFIGQRGAWQPFDFVNPNDQRAYRVRFDPSVSVDLFTPAIFAVDGLRLTVVDDDVFTDVSAFPVPAEGDFGYGVQYGADAGEEVGYG